MSSLPFSRPHCPFLNCMARTPRQRTMSGKEDGDKPRGSNTVTLPWVLDVTLHAPAPSTSIAPHLGIPGSSRGAQGCQASAPGGRGITAGGDEREAGAQPQGLKKVVPKMSGKGCLSLRGDSGQRQLPACHIPHPAVRAMSVQQEALPPRESIAQPRAGYPRHGVSGTHLGLALFTEPTQ